MGVMLDSDRMYEEHNHKKCQFNIWTVFLFSLLSPSSYFHSTVNDIYSTQYIFKFAYILSEDQLVKLETNNTMTPTGCIQIELLLKC